MEHKRCVVHIARKAAESMTEFMGRALPIDQDTVVAGAILADVGKLLEYEQANGKIRQSRRGKMLRHPFTGVALAMQCGVPDAVCHIIASHAAEGDLVKRTTEAYIVHHADLWRTCHSRIWNGRRQTWLSRNTYVNQHADS